MPRDFAGDEIIGDFARDVAGDVELDALRERPKLLGRRPSEPAQGVARL